MAPQAFQIVVAPCRLGKNVHDKVPVVHQNPFGGVIAFNAHRKLAHVLQLFLDLIADGMALAGIRNSTEDEEVGERRDLAQVKDAQARGFFRLSRTRSRTPVRELSGGCRGGGFNRTAGQTRLNVLLRLAY